MKQTNKHIKYIKRFSIMIVTLLLSFTIISQKAYALDPNDFDGFFVSYDVKDIYASNRPVNMSSNYLETYLPVDVSAYSDYDFAIFDLSALLPVQILVIDSIMDGPVQRGTHLRLLDGSNVELTKVFDIFNYNYLAQYTIPNGVAKIEIVATYLVDNPSMTEFQRLQQQSVVSGTLNQRALSGSSFLHFYREGVLMDAEQFFDYLNTYIDEYKASQQLIYDQIFNNTQSTYGIFYNGGWLTADQWGDIEYNRGLQSGQGEAYDEGYLKGSNDSFMASIKDWIVPAIIVVLFLGGALTIVAKKREG